MSLLEIPRTVFLIIVQATDAVGRYLAELIPTEVGAVSILAYDRQRITKINGGLTLRREMVGVSRLNICHCKCLL